jgi:hypothetical protein
MGDFDTKCGYLRLSNRSMLQKLSKCEWVNLSLNLQVAQFQAAAHSPAVSIMLVQWLGWIYD